MTYQVKVVGDSLTLSSRPASVQVLRPSYPDGFNTPVATVWFTRDRRGRVNTLHLSDSSMWDLVVPRAR